VFTPKPTSAAPVFTPKPTSAAPVFTPKPTVAAPEFTPKPTVAAPEFTPKPTAEMEGSIPVCKESPVPGAYVGPCEHSESGQVKFMNKEGKLLDTAPLKATVLSAALTDTTDSDSSSSDCLDVDESCTRNSECCSGKCSKTNGDSTDKYCIESESTEAPESAPVFTPKPTSAAPVFTPKPTSAAPVFTPKPTVAAPEFTPKPTVAAPEFTPKPTAEMEGSIPVCKESPVPGAYVGPCEHSESGQVKFMNKEGKLIDLHAKIATESQKTSFSLLKSPLGIAGLALVTLAAAIVTFRRRRSSRSQYSPLPIISM